MDYLEQNIVRFWMVKALAKQLRDHEIEEPVQVQMKAGGDLKMVYRNASLYPEQGTIVSAAKDIQSLVGERQQDLVVFFGLGMGIHAEFIKKRFDAPLLIFEPSLDILKTALSLRAFQLEDTMLESSFGRLSELVERKLEHSDRKIIIAAHPGYQALFPDEFERFVFLVRQALNNVIIRDNTMQRGLLWSRFQMKNLRRSLMAPSILGLKKFCSGVPGIFVGAGPSLSRNIELLRDAQGKALIIAASTALQPLDNAGVRPDVVMVIESNDHRYQYQGVRCLEDITVAPTAFAHPSNFEVPAKRVFSLLTHPTAIHDWITRAYGPVDAVVTGGSVALAAFSVLYEIGCNPLIALGMDLAFTDDETHVSGAKSAAVGTRFDSEKSQLEYYVKDAESDFFAMRQQKLENGQILSSRPAVPCAAWGTGEKTLYTDPVFNGYRAWLEGAADTWASGKTLINASEGGGRIRGFEEISFRQVLEKFIQKTYPIEQWMMALDESFEPPDLSPLKTVIRDEFSLVHKVNDLAQKCRSSALRCISLIDENRLVKAQRELERLSAVEKEIGLLSRETRILNQISHKAAASLRLSRHEDKSDDQLVQMKNSLGRSVKLFEEIRNGCKNAIPLFEMADAQLADSPESDNP
jgi:hypothetical protein